MKARNVELFQCPRVLMVESSIPDLAAAVAAPMRKLCPANPGMVDPALGGLSECAW